MTHTFLIFLGLFGMESKSLRDYCFVWLFFSEKVIVRNKISILLCTFAYFLSYTGSWLIFPKIQEKINDRDLAYIRNGNIDVFIQRWKSFRNDFFQVWCQPSSFLDFNVTLFHQRCWNRKCCGSMGRAQCLLSGGSAFTSVWPGQFI